MLITCFSTVGAEAVYFHKPLLILDHLGQDVQGYIREKVAFEARDWQTLEEVLLEVLSGKKTDKS